MNDTPIAVTPSQPVSVEQLSPGSTIGQSAHINPRQGMHADPTGHPRRDYGKVPEHIEEQYVKTIVGAEE